MIQELKRKVRTTILGESASSNILATPLGISHTVIPDKQLTLNNWCRVYKLSSNYGNRKLNRR